MKTTGQMGAPAPAPQRQADTATARKKPSPQAGATDAQPAQQGGEGGSAQFTDWAAI